jgi:hypothetical protein
MKEITVTMVLEIPEDLQEFDFCKQLERIVDDHAAFEFVRVSNYSEDK